MKVLHLHLFSHPAPIGEGAIQYALSLAQDCGAQLRVTVPRVAVDTSAHWLMGPTLTGMARDVEQRADQSAEAAALYVQARGEALGVAVSVDHYTQSWPPLAGEDVWRGRTSDLCILPLQAQAEHRLVAEDWLFHLGRPLLILPPAFDTPRAFDRAVVAWDLSRPAARALADAAPLLQRFKDVRILIVRGEKDLPSFDIAAPLARYLEAHDVKYGVDEIPMAGAIAKTILSYCDNLRADLLVMGAFGHSRARQFLLGGATKGVLDKLTLPVLMSH